MRPVRQWRRGESDAVVRCEGETARHRPARHLRGFETRSQDCVAQIFDARDRNSRPCLWSGRHAKFDQAAMSPSSSTRRTHRNVMSPLGLKATYAPHKRMSALRPGAAAKADICPRSSLPYLQKADMSVHGLMPASGPRTRTCQPWAARQNSCLPATLVQAGSLPINHIAAGSRTLAPFAYGASAWRSEATTAETTSAGWLRSQLLTAPIWAD